MLPSYNVRESDLMTVAIDPSQVRRQATVKGRAALAGLRLPPRTLLLGGLGCAGLLAFTIGAFSFFDGLADPRVRRARPAPIASQMPDLKDGLPALVSENGQSAPAATVLNLPKPSVSEPTPAKTEVALRSEAPEPAAPAVQADRPEPPDATGSVAQRQTASVRARPTPQIENAATVSGDAKPVPLIAPVRTAGPLSPKKGETVRAKAVAVAALPSEPEPAAAPKPGSSQNAEAEAKAAPAKKPAQKVARAKAKPVAEASAEPDSAPAPAAAPEPEDGFDAKVKSGIKAIGGMFGQE